MRDLISEAERTDSGKEWMTAAIAVVCFFGRKRFGDICKVRVEDVAMTRHKVTVHMKRNKTFCVLGVDS